MVNKLEYIQNIKDYFGTVRLADDSIIQVSKIGQIEGKMFDEFGQEHQVLLNEVLFVPSLEEPLFSVTQSNLDGISINF
ncbi:hypothetical protein HMI56_004077 [Coelomomyces lativittatus]|nr:hypothetical protein HMI56_004077 [Coelomomyces lativittatus]